MKKRLIMKFGAPADDSVNKKGGQFGAFRHRGTHTGLDFLSDLDPVYASESGVVAYSGVREGSVTKTNYGHTMGILSSLIIPLKSLMMKDIFTRSMGTLIKGAHREDRG